MDDRCERRGGAIGAAGMGGGLEMAQRMSIVRTHWPVATSH